MSIAHPIDPEIRHHIEARLSAIGAKLNIRGVASENGK